MIEMDCKVETKIEILEGFEGGKFFQNACACPLSSFLSSGFEAKQLLEIEDKLFEETSDAVIKRLGLNEEDMINISMRSVLRNAKHKASQMNIISFWPLIDREVMKRVGMNGIVFLRAKDVASAKKFMDEFDDDIRMGIFVDPLIDGDEVVNLVSDLAGKFQLPVMIKLYDDLEKTGKLDSLCGMSPTKYIENVGLLDRECYIFGGVHADKDDFEVWAGYGANAVVSPTTFLNTGKGMANIYAMQGSGVNVRLASYLEDNILNEIKMATLLTRGMMSDASLFEGEDAEKLAYADNPGEVCYLGSAKYEEACKKILERINREV